RPHRGARYGDLFQRARAAAVREGFGWTHTLCHGDLGLWELLETARRLSSAPLGRTGRCWTRSSSPAWRRAVRWRGSRATPSHPG
ncbi:hypothetical protein, partial [Corallococcus sp. 4LFB]|uniref:hypothetical protein n=1 Tax=Corallococcus sp. 4LFB TaxID=3383249 RepID=UPI0039765BDA